MRQEPIADQRADDADADVGDEPEAGALHDLTGKPAGNEPDDQDDEKTFSRHGDLPESVAKTPTLTPRRADVTWRRRAPPHTIHTRACSVPDVSVEIVNLSSAHQGRRRGSLYGLPDGAVGLRSSG